MVHGNSGSTGGPALAAAIDAVATETSFSGVVRVDQPGVAPLVAAYGLAHRGWNVPNDAGTRFAMASGSKTFTAVAVLSLIDDGALTLDTPARVLLGGDLPAIDDAVTVEQLLAHRSGIGDYLDEDAGSVNDYVLRVPVHELATTDGYVSVLEDHPMVSPPGERFSYCNSGYVVLALIAERASGKLFHDLVAERVTKPAGMVDTAYLRSDELSGGVARGYLSAEGLRTNVLHLPVRGSGDGGAYTTAADVHRFWDALLSSAIISPALVEDMLRPRTSPSGGQFGYGLGVWLGAVGTAIMEGMDAGVSFRSVHLRATATTVTVLSNTSGGAWPVLRAIAV